MAHAIESMFSVRQTPWHGLGEILTDHPTIETAIVKAGLNWTVETEPLFATDKRGGYEDVSKFGKVVRRSDTGKVIDIVGPSYTPLQNSQSFDWFRPFLESGECFLTTAGSLHHGRIIWVMAEINRGTMVIDKGDEVRKFILLSNSHDGSKAVRIGFTPVRVVCANTLGMAHRDKESKLLRVKHTSKVVSTLSQIRETVDMIDSQFNATAEQYRRLAKCKINKNDLRNYVTVLLASNPEQPTTREQTVIDDAISRALTGRGQNPDNLTVWAAYNGITEFLSYATKHRSTDARFDSLWFGDNKTLLDNAFTEALNMAA